MKRPLLLMALIWVPFVSLFAFAAPPVADRVGDSYPHLAFHAFAPALLAIAFVRTRRILSDAATRAQRALLWVLSVTVPVAVVGNLVEFAAALQRFSQDGWVSRRTPEIFEEPGLHSWGAALTIPGLMLSMVTVLVLVVTTLFQSRRHLEPVR